MTTKLIHLLTAIIFAGLLSCHKSPQQAETASPIAKHNFIVLLDLSDRLLTPNQVERDKEIIRTVFYLFKAKVKEHLYIKSQDEFKIILAPQKNMSVELLEMQNQLRVNLEKLPINKKKSAVDKMEKDLEQTLTDLYGLAMQNKKVSTDFFGADIWQYFNEDLQSDLQKDGQNHLFVLTDGYMAFENYDHALKQGNRHSSCKFMAELRGNDWENKFDKGDYGIITPRQKYQNLNVMILEINPKGEFLNEYDLLQKTWRKWLNEMEIREVEIYKISPIKKLQEKMSSFLAINVLPNSPKSSKPIHKAPIEQVPTSSIATENSSKLPTENPTTLQFVGSINGNLRLLELRNPVNIAANEIVYDYTIKGMGNREKDKKCTLNLESKTVYFETLGKGLIAMKNQFYHFTSEQNDWELTQRP
jgi:hypothetical protein